MDSLHKNLSHMQANLFLCRCTGLLLLPSYLSCAQVQLRILSEALNLCYLKAAIFSITGPLISSALQAVTSLLTVQVVKLLKCC
jgi:hypothetical protein